MIPTNGAAPLNKMIARALDKKYLQTTSPDEPVVQIKNHLCFCAGAFIASCTTVERYTKWHRQNKPINQGLSCLCLWAGAFSRILYICVQIYTTKTYLFNRGLVVYVHGLLLFVTSCTSVYKYAPSKQTYLSGV